MLPGIGSKVLISMKDKQLTICLSYQHVPIMTNEWHQNHLSTAKIPTECLLTRKVKLLSAIIAATVASDTQFISPLTYLHIIPVI